MSRDVDRGAVAIVVAVFAIVAMILLAFVVDRGRIYVQRAQLQNAVDAAALAAVPATCGNPIASAASVRQLAVDYGVLNGVTISPGDVIVQDGPNDATTGVSVAAEQTVSSFFGGFAGVGDSVVAARATATRPCQASYRIIAEQLVQLSGGKSVGGRIYAGACFSSNGNNGSYDYIAVSTEEFDFGPCGSVNPPNGVPVELAGNTLNNPPPAYGVPQPELTTAYAASAIANVPGYSESELIAKLAGTQNCTDFTTDIVCSAGLTLPNSAVSVAIISGGEVVFANNTDYLGPLIYSTSTSSKAIETKSGFNPTSIAYAPNGTVQFTGSGAVGENAGIIIAKTVDFNGGSQDASGGVPIRTALDWRLAQ